MSITGHGPVDADFLIAISRVSLIPSARFRGIKREIVSNSKGGAAWA